VTPMKLELDREANAAYVTSSEDEVKRTRKLDSYRILDLDAEGEVIGIEFLRINAGVDLSDLPRAAELRKLLNEHHIKQSA
jgi:uncharacterized protein YuzE